MDSCRMMGTVGKFLKSATMSMMSTELYTRSSSNFTSFSIQEQTGDPAVVKVQLCRAEGSDALPASH